MNLSSVGALCTSIVVGYLVKFWTRRMQSFSAKALGALLAVVFTGAAIAYLDRAVWGWYPIGLLLGVVGYIAIGYKVLQRSGRLDPTNPHHQQALRIEDTQTQAPRPPTIGPIELPDGGVILVRSDTPERARQDREGI